MINNDLTLVRYPFAAGLLLNIWGAKPVVHVISKINDYLKWMASVLNIFNYSAFVVIRSNKNFILNFYLLIICQASVKGNSVKLWILTILNSYKFYSNYLNNFQKFNKRD